MRHVAWDLETHLIKKGLLTPRMVCLTFAEQVDRDHVGEPERISAAHQFLLPAEADAEFEIKEDISTTTNQSRGTFAQGIMLRDQAPAWLRAQLLDPGVTIVGHNTSFDLAVAAATDPELFGLIFDKYEAGLIHDTQIRQQLIDIATGEAKFHTDEEGEPKKTSYDLASLARRLLDKHVQKKDTYRLRYAELDGVPLSQWPEEASGYAIGDAVTTAQVHAKQDEIAGGPIPNSAEQHRAAWALHLMSVWGVRTDGPAVAKLKTELEADFRRMMLELRPTGLLKIVPSRLVTRGALKGQTTAEKVTKNMKAIKARVVACYEGKGALQIVGGKEIAVIGEPREVPLSDSGKNVSTSKKTLVESGDPQLKKLAEAGGVGKLLNTYVPVLESGTKVPICPRYNVLVETGRTSCSQPNCFDGETEILTAEGWVRFDQYVGGKVAQFFTEDQRIDFIDPVQVHRYAHNAKLLRHKNEHIDLVTTSDHRCLIQNRKTEAWRVVSASELPEDWRILNSGHFAGGEGLPLSDAELILLCALQADGTYHDSGLDFTFYKKRKQDRFRGALVAATAKYAEGDRKAYGEIVGRRFRIQKSDLVDRLTALLGPGKVFGHWLLQMSRHQIDIFCKEVFHWDGCFTRMNHFASSKPVNSDWVQILLTLSGRRAKVRIYDNGNPRALLSHQVDVSRNGYSLTTNIERSETEPAAEVYCVSVPSGFIVVRRSGAAVIVGNCQNPPRGGGVRECFVPRPGWVYAFSDYDTLELRALAQVCLDVLGQSQMAEALRRGEDLHLSLAAEMLGITLDEAKRHMDAGDAEIAEYRQQAKPANFGFPGGMAAESFREYAEGYQIFLTSEQAKNIHSTWFRKWSEMEPYFAWVNSLTQGDEPIMQIRSGRVRGGAGYCAVANGFFQGLAADGAKEALWLVAKECYIDKTSALYGCRPCFFLHDEIGIEIPRRWIGAARASAATERLSAVMVEAMKKWIPDVPISCGPYMVRRWYKGAKAVRIGGNIVPAKPSKGVDDKGKAKTIWVADLDDVDERMAA